AVPEAEWWAMAPPGVSIHAARVSAPTPWAAWDAGKTAVTLSDDLARGARQFAAMNLSAVVLGHTSSSVVGGKGWDAATVTALQAVIGGTTFVTTNGLDTMAALAALKVARPFLVLPAWYPEPTVAAALAYYTDHGLAPAGHLRMVPAAKWQGIPPGELYPRGMAVDQEIEPLFDQIVAACPENADGVLIGGTGFRCSALIEGLEKKLGRPVVAANQASLWHCLRNSSAHGPIAGYGKLLAAL
ncbi:MAG: hypothetical protein JSR47_19920, partial [Proteobacteria bacterium]|nr:hypothetical protein [Pseudomonadota bacterium]